MDRETSIVEGKSKSWYQANETFLSDKRRAIKLSKAKVQSQNVVSVPFDWEIKPGTPKHPQSETVPPSIKPSPAVESQTLVIPSFASARTTTTSCFWIKSRKGKMCERNANGRRGCVHGDNNVIDVEGKGNHSPDSVVFPGVNFDSTLSSDHSRTCSSSSSVSTSSSSNSNISGSSNSSSLRSFGKGLIKWSF